MENWTAEMKGKIGLALMEKLSYLGIMMRRFFMLMTRLSKVGTINMALQSRTPREKAHL